MKKKDLAPLILVAGISALLSFFISGALITPSDKTESAEVVRVLSSEFIRPDSAYFNENSVNPAQNIEAGQPPTEAGEHFIQGEKHRLRHQ